MAVFKYFTGRLYDRMSDDLHLAGMSDRTHGSYLRANVLEKIPKSSRGDQVEHTPRLSQRFTLRGRIKRDGSNPVRHGIVPVK